MSDTAANNGNQRVTNAVLALKIDNLTEMVRHRIDDHEDRLRAVEAGQSDMKAQLKFIAGAQALLTLVSSAIAGVLGARS